jgi:hypothetical protein
MRQLILSAFGAYTLAASILHSRRLEHSRIMKINVIRLSRAEKGYGEWRRGRNITGMAAAAGKKRAPI